MLGWLRRWTYEDPMSRRITLHKKAMFRFCGKTRALRLFGLQCQRICNQFRDFVGPDYFQASVHDRRLFLWHELPGDLPSVAVKFELTANNYRSTRN
jgi:hypothetical protein